MKKLNIAIAAGVVAALVGALLVISYGRNIDEKIAEGRETVPVLVASQDIAAGTAAQSLGELVKVEEIPRAYVSSGAISDLKDVTGLSLVAPIPLGTQLTQGLFGTESQVTQLEPAEGSVALAVQVDLPAGVARYVSPGSFVDVFGTFEGEGPIVEKPRGAYDRTKLFLSGARVLSVSPAQPVAEEDEQTGQALPVDQVIVVLEVRPADAERVVNVAELGHLYLALAREGEDHKTGSGVTPDVVVKNRL